MGLKAFSIQMDGVAIMAGLLPVLASFASILQGMGLLVGLIISTPLRAFGDWPGVAWQNSKDCQNTSFLCISKEPGGDTITALLII